MSGATTRYAIPFLTSGDAVNLTDDLSSQQAQRLDLLLGESGAWSPVMAANTVVSQAIVLSRTYPGNTGAAVPGIVLIQNGSAMGAGVIVGSWVLGASWTGSATTITGFTLNAISSTAATRTFLWRFIPVL